MVNFPLKLRTNFYSVGLLWLPNLQLHFLDNISQITLSYNQFKTRVKNHLCRKWQDRWDTINSPPHQPLHLYPIKPVIKDWPSAYRNNREEEIVLARLRLRACLFNKKHLFEKQPHPECEHCDVPLSIQHILIDCDLFYNERGPMLTVLRENDLPIEVTSILNEYFPAKLWSHFIKISTTSIKYNIYPITF